MASVQQASEQRSSVIISVFLSIKGEEDEVHKVANELLEILDSVAHEFESKHATTRVISVQATA